MSALRSDVEENGTQDAKVSDSGYSNSCRNSQSQRSTGSSESRHSSSSRSSGYGGHQPGASTDGSARKEKEGKKKMSEEVKARPPPPPPPPPDLDQQSNNFVVEVEQTEKARSQDVLQIAALTQTLSSIKKLKHKDRAQDDSEPTNQPPIKVDEKTQEKLISCLKVDQTNEEEMLILVSMQDGVVLYTSSNLTAVLGFPKDMWVGRSLIDFVHPRHRMAFASHITSVIASQDTNGSSKTKPGGFYCCLRKYRGLKVTGFSVTDKRVTYLPCQMMVTFRELSGSEGLSMFLVITTSPIQSAYKYPEESKVSPKFSMRHCASTVISHVDPEVIPYLGYLPQDLIGQSILEFYHPDDLSHIKQLYHSVMNEQRQPVRSRPYRFRSQNGGFVLLETEWSAFINPWSRKLEFMICQHIVLKGPLYPDVITPVETESIQLNEEQTKEIRKHCEEIKALLSTMVGCSTETAKQQVSKRCKDLATFMESLMDEITRPPDLKVDVPMDDEKSFSERDSVMLGEISPHHEYFDSKSSSETPPSYNQLNYKENLQRFFESKPNTSRSDESAESKSCPPQNSASEDNKSSPQIHPSSPNNQRACMFGEGSGGESSAEGPSSSGSGAVERPVPLIAPSLPSVPLPNYNPPLLTEKLLSRHNEVMEKKMVQRHREQRNKSGEGKNKEKHKSSFDKQQEEGGCHGLKRSGSHSFEGEPFKSIKASHSESQPVVVQPAAPAPPPTTSSVNLWPSFTPTQSLNSTRPNGVGGGLASTLFPMYCIPQEGQPRPDPIPHPFIPPQVGQNGNFVPGMLYQPIAMLGPPTPFLYSPLTVLPTPVFPPHPPMRPPPNHLTPPQCSRCDGDRRRRAGSQTTSVKAQPGSIATSTSLKQVGNCQHAGSEPCKSSQQKAQVDGDSYGTSNIYDDSSFYSSFGSYPFVKTDKSDESMKSSPENDVKSEDMCWERSEKQHGGGKCKPVRMVAPWMQEITVTPELTLKYQLRERGLEDILKADIQLLEKINQPSLVNDQLGQMYLDLELEGLSKNLTLEEGITSSSSDSAPDVPTAFKRKKKRYMMHEKMAILYEENAPLPPPLVEPLPCT